MLNKVIMIGRLTNDPEYKETDNYKMARFTIAVDRDYVSKDGERGTDFPRCVAFGGTASFIQKYFSKGDMISLVGRLKIDVDRTDGYKEFVSIEVESAYFGGAKKAGESSGKKQTKDNDQTRIEDTSEYRFQELNGDGDLPF